MATMSPMWSTATSTTRIFVTIAVASVHFPRAVHERDCGISRICWIPEKLRGARQRPGIAGAPKSVCRAVFIRTSPERRICRSAGRFAKRCLTCIFMPSLPWRFSRVQKLSGSRFENSLKHSRRPVCRPSPGRRRRF